MSGVYNISQDEVFAGVKMAEKQAKEMFFLRLQRRFEINETLYRQRIRAIATLLNCKGEKKS